MKSILKQLHNVEDEPEGPSVDSADLEERIQCRRLRIKNRVENQRKLEMGEIDADKHRHVDLTKSRAQIELSRTRINKLTEDGLEFLTNVKVASDARENERRSENEEITRVRREKLEAEAKSALDRFEEITKKWDSALQKEVPQDLLEMLNEQLSSCGIMIDDKNKLISDLEKECKEKDSSYVNELKKQSDDIDLMVERMKDQISCMNKACRDELIEIEKAFMAQRDDLIRLQNRDWNELLEAIKSKQIDYLEARAKRAEDNENAVSNMRIEHSEQYNEMKIQFENEVQKLEQDIQMAKATYQLNLEKLEYNFQVLKKRDEENTITKSQQKRKITKLQDLLNVLKQKQVHVDRHCKGDNENLTDDFKRRMELFRELQQKSRTLLKADAKHFKDIWLMNEEEIQKAAKKLLEADKIICEQQFGISWACSSFEFLKNKGPIYLEETKESKGKSAVEIIRDVYNNQESTAEEVTHRTDKSGQESDSQITIDKLNPHTVKALLNILCDEASFLIEDKLKKLLEPLEHEEASLMKLDAIFSALGIDNEEDINKMLPYFVIQLYDGNDSTVGETEELTKNILMSSMVNKNVIHPTKIIQALHEFISDFYRDNIEMEKIRAYEKGDDFQLDAVDTRDDSKDSEYWDMYKSTLIPQDKVLLWDAAIDAMDKYLIVLNYRKKLLTDIDAYKVQNTELKFLLQQYLNSSANKDLQVPPSKVIQYN